ncbi:hypothetical protein SLS62_005477 [Diatrype stigma]|uniref:Uncharacterized protein n=1 Tax=Diatrype stigma TaxID=117547 RepID=A0AAN9YSG5_9PEZI
MNYITGGPMSAFAVSLSNPLRQQLRDDARQLLLYFGIRHRLEFRQLAIKHGLTSFAREDVRNELKILRRLTGAEHVVQMIPLTPFGQVVGPDVAGNALSRPFFVMGVAQDGPLSAWVGRELESPVLWSIFLCSTRWPRSREKKHPGKAPLANGISHNYMHLYNALLDEFRGDAEHLVSPRVKFIDFGLATEEAELNMPCSTTGPHGSTFRHGQRPGRVRRECAGDDTRAGLRRDDARTARSGQEQALAERSEGSHHPLPDRDEADRPSLGDLLKLCETQVTGHRNTRREQQGTMLRSNAEEENEDDNHVIA